MHFVSNGTLWLFTIIDHLSVESWYFCLMIQKYDDKHLFTKRERERKTGNMLGIVDKANFKVFFLVALLELLITSHDLPQQIGECRISIFLSPLRISPTWRLYSWDWNLTLDLEIIGLTTVSEVKSDLNIYNSMITGQTSSDEIMWRSRTATKWTLLGGRVLLNVILLT